MLLLQIMFFLFLILGALLIVNMLIAMMGNIYLMVAETKKEWTRQVTCSSLKTLKLYDYFSQRYTVITAKKNMFWCSKNVCFSHSGRELCWPQSACSHLQRGLPRRKSIHRVWVLMGKGRWSWDCEITKIDNRCEASFIFIKDCLWCSRFKEKPEKQY